MLEISPTISIPLATIKFTYVRSSGPGGQNVNKVASKAVLRWNLPDSGLFNPAVIERFIKAFPSYYTSSGDVVITSQESRDAPKNRDLCLEKLQAMLRAALVVPKKRIPTKPTKGSIRRRLEDKSKLSEKKSNRRNKVDE